MNKNEQLTLFDLKECSRCHQHKSTNDFHKASNNVGGYHGICKICRSKAKPNGKCMGCGVRVSTAAIRCRKCHRDHKTQQYLERNNEKRCRKCDEIKNSTEFHRDISRPDGLENNCKSCKRQYGRDRYKRAKELAGQCECGRSLSSKRSVKCASCSRRGEGSSNWRGGKFLNSQGYVYLSNKRDHPNANAAGKILEHIFVMSSYLGRPLTLNENVHHKNGIRDDNRIENLELWSVSQPAGQRVKDKISWAIEFLQEYGYDVRKESEGK